MKYTIAYISNLFGVEKRVVKNWTSHFFEYLNPLANPPKGHEKAFIVDDIRVLAFIFLYWEEEPDIEYIKMGLNSNSHFANELIDKLMIEISPFFRDPPENIDETWKHGVLFSGLAEFGDRYFLAKSYKIAGDRLIDTALKNDEQWELFCPAVYCYRHATELFMKDIIGYDGKSHNLLNLFEIFQKLLKTEFNSQIPDWFANIITTFNNFDQNGTSFRYGDNSTNDEVFIDFIQLKTIMNWMSKAFQNVKEH